MAQPQQDEGWPLGLLQPARIELMIRNTVDNAGSISFNTLLTASPPSSSTLSNSSDLDTQSTGSFFPDQSTTLGSLMGVSNSNIVEVSSRSLRGTKTELFKTKNKKYNLSSWLFCLGGSRSKNNPPSLGQFLAVERKAANENNPHDEANIAERNSLFMNGIIAPPHSIISPRQREHNKGFGLFHLPTCLHACVMCGHDGFG